MTRRYRMAFLMQQVLGHATYSAGLERAVREDAEIDAVWRPITYWRSGGLIERVPILPRGVRGVLRGALGVQRAIAARKLDAILFNTPALATFAPAWMRATPAVIALDVTPRQFDEEGIHFGHRHDRGHTGAIKHSWNRHVFSRAAAFAPWSTWARASLERDYGIEPTRSFVIPPGVDTEAWSRRAGPARGKPRVLFVGGDFKRKGGDLVIEWFRTRGRGRCELDIVTRDPAVAVTAPDVRVHRYLRPNDPELRRLYWSSDVFVMPSRSEPFGIACVEALAAGLPVVATTVGGISDIVEDGVTGRLVPPDDVEALSGALDPLVDWESLREAMGVQAARVARERFDARKNYGTLIALMKTAAERKDAAPAAVRKAMAR